MTKVHFSRLPQENDKSKGIQWGFTMRLTQLQRFKDETLFCLKKKLLTAFILVTLEP